MHQESAGPYSGEIKWSRPERKRVPVIFRTCICALRFLLLVLYLLRLLLACHCCADLEIHDASTVITLVHPLWEQQTRKSPESTAKSCAFPFCRLVRRVGRSIEARPAPIALSSPRQVQLFQGPVSSRVLATNPRTRNSHFLTASWLWLNNKDCLRCSCARCQKSKCFVRIPVLSSKD